MKNIPIQVSTEDKNALKSLNSQLKNIGGKVQQKINSQADILDRFERTLEKEQSSLRETIIALLAEVKNPTLLGKIFASE